MLSSIHSTCLTALWEHAFQRDSQQLLWTTTSVAQCKIVLNVRWHVTTRGYDYSAEKLYKCLWWLSCPIKAHTKLMKLQRDLATNLQTAKPRIHVRSLQDHHTSCNHSSSVALVMLAWCSDANGWLRLANICRTAKLGRIYGLMVCWVTGLFMHLFSSRDWFIQVDRASLS